MIRFENKYWPGFGKGKGVCVTFYNGVFISLLRVTWRCVRCTHQTCGFLLPSASVCDQVADVNCRYEVDVLKCQETVVEVIRSARIQIRTCISFQIFLFSLILLLVAFIKSLFTCVTNVCLWYSPHEIYSFCSLWQTCSTSATTLFYFIADVTKVT